MLEIARKRLGASADLHCQNILSLSLPGAYDVAISQGGVWYVARSQAGEQFLESHLVEEAENAAALARVAQVLVPGGMLLVGIQDEHRDFAGLKLDGGAEYSQSVSYRGPLIEKDYFVEKGGETLAYQHCTFRRFSPAEGERLLAKAGFADLGPDESGLFRVFERLP